jgi:hypothetical protein
MAVLGLRWSLPQRPPEETALAEDASQPPAKKKRKADCWQAANSGNSTARRPLRVAAVAEMKRMAWAHLAACCTIAERIQPPRAKPMW